MPEAPGPDAPVPEASGPIHIVGLIGGQPWGKEAAAALAGAEVVFGSPRHLRAAGVSAPRAVPWSGDLQALFDDMAARRAAGRSVCLLASGDPGFFGVAERARRALGPTAIRVHPAPSSVSLAFARVGERWDDAVVVSAHGRPLAEAARRAARHPKVAVLTAPDQPPEALGRALVDLGTGPRRVTVVSRLGEADEEVTHGDLGALAAGRFDGLSVVLLRAPVEEDGAGGADGAGPTLAWGTPESVWDHRAGMITKAEVRAVALGKLGLPAAGVLWDIGAGSGSVAAECARLCPGLEVFAVERRADDVARIRANTAGLGVRVVEGEAPGALGDLPDPDRVFLGGGGLDVLEAVLERLRPGGRVVATWATISRAAEAGRRLGQLVQISVSRGVPLGEDAELRLAPDNPVFVTWGPTVDPAEPSR